MKNQGLLFELIKIYKNIFSLLYYRDSLAFATESCFGSLANCLGFYDNIAQPIPKEFDDYKLHDVEIRYGIVQV